MISIGSLYRAPDGGCNHYILSDTISPYEDTQFCRVCRRDVHISDISSHIMEKKFYQYWVRSGDDEWLSAYRNGSIIFVNNKPQKKES